LDAVPPPATFLPSMLIGGRPVKVNVDELMGLSTGVIGK
jgi:hypothetical protein